MLSSRIPSGELSRSLLSKNDVRSKENKVVGKEQAEDSVLNIHVLRKWSLEPDSCSRRRHHLAEPNTRIVELLSGLDGRRRLSHIAK